MLEVFAASYHLCQILFCRFLLTRFEYFENIGQQLKLGREREIERERKRERESEKHRYRETRERE